MTPVIRLFLLCFMVAASVNGQTKDPTKTRLIRDAMTNITPLREFGELYTNGFYTLKKENGRNLLEVRTLLTPYYELVMRVPVSTPEGDRPLLQVSSAEVEIWKLTRIYYDIGGTLIVDRAFPPIDISVGQWARLVQAKGNYAAIGVQMESGLRIDKLDKYRDKLRSEADVGW